eukprot:CAMPEP_0177770870 /NCGR_PEP_ID=MMETSP0491_2-20121128/11205_1 /TAXON_ID=63592 /ORGANISM="Tetraselmis chuii, Strain PLY429" /LENGTH=402 /DNA_ID=CAMNT_0019288213 /DNA_START=166 /DNA_END=1374 /DNA_ORIENTATION=+
MSSSGLLRQPPRRHATVGTPRRQPLRVACTTRREFVRVAATEPESNPSMTASDDPLLLRVARGEKVERPPVWMMRQAGRYMKIYRDLCKKPGCTTFRERSENADLATEISLQPWRAFKPDGIILFSDILTPLAGMNIPFDIVPGKGPLITDPIREMSQLEAITRLVPEESMGFVGETLKNIREEVGNEATMLGFVGAPFTLATYIIEGGTTATYQKTKNVIYTKPELLHSLCAKLAESLADYIRYQADSGAQVVQIFDSWAANITPGDYDTFAAPYVKQMVESVKASHPDLPIILYISGSGGLLERMAATGVDIVSVDHSVAMSDAVSRIAGLRDTFGVQGNLDPSVLFSDRDVIEKRVIATAKAAASRPHIMNLGHGVMVGTPEDNVAHFFEVTRTLGDRM